MRANITQEIREAALEIRRKNIAEDRERMAALVENLTPPKIEHPPAQPGGMVYWNEEEIQKLLTLCQAAKDKAAPVLDWPDLENNARKYLTFKIVEAVQDKFFPPHRRRMVVGLASFPVRIQPKILKMFELKNPADEPLANSLNVPINNALNHAAAGHPVPEATPVPRPGSWTAHEEDALLGHLCEAMRKQGIGIPEPTDRFGSILFKDMIIAAQNAVIPTHRRRDLTNARQILVAAGMIPRLQKMLDAYREAPPAPSATASPAPENSVQIIRSTNGHNGKLAVPGSALAEMLRGVADRIEQDLGTAKQEAHEAHEWVEAVMKENSELRERLERLEGKFASLETQAQAKPRRELPRVAVLGCHLNEFTHIMEKAREAGLELEFKHYDQDANPVNIREDYALMLKWAPAGWVQKMKDSGIPMHRRAQVDGGISRAVMQLQVWFAPVNAQTD